jgi:hypothetical protein
MLAAVDAAWHTIDQHGLFGRYTKRPFAEGPPVRQHLKAQPFNGPYNSMDFCGIAIVARKGKPSQDSLPLALSPVDCQFLCQLPHSLFGDPESPSNGFIRHAVIT